MKRLFLIFILVLFCFFGNAYGRKIFKYSERGSTDAIGPTKAGLDNRSAEMSALIFDTLYQYKYLADPLQVEPNLAVGMPQISENGLTYTIKIKKGTMFTDDSAFPRGKGREVIAEDFIYSIKRHFDRRTNSRSAYLWKGKIVGMKSWSKRGAKYDRDVKGLKALDRYTIQITLTKPYPALIYTFTHGASGIVAREVIEHYGKGVFRHPVGSGPFKLKTFNPRRAVLVRNPGYRKEIINLDGYDEKIHGKYGIQKLKGKKVPMIDELQFYFIEEALVRFNSLKKGNEIQYGEIDPQLYKKVLASKIPLKLRPEFEKKFNHTVITNEGFTGFYFNMSTKAIGYSKDPLLDKRNRALRRAMRKAFNWKMFGKRYYNNFYNLNPGLLSSGVVGFDKNTSRESITYDPEGAKKLLRDNGWNAKTLPLIEFHYPARVKSRQWFDLFRGLMKKIGIPKNKIKGVSYANQGDFNQALFEGRVMIGHVTWGITDPDAEGIMRLGWSGNLGGMNIVNFSNPEFDELYLKITVSNPSPERTKMITRMNELFINDAAMITSLQAKKLTLWYKNVIFYQRTMIQNILKYVDIE